MISTRSKWLIGGFSIAPISYAILIFFSFRMLHEVQAEQVKPGTLPPPNLLVQSALLKLAPVLFFGMVAGSVFALLALISLVLDHRTRKA
jgi:hypothetical protein